MNVHQTIIQGVKEQLFLNNYLVLPGFGGFVLKKTPSHFSSAGGMIFPPAKTINFNAQLKQNDGLLSQWLQTSLGCDNAQALAHLADFAEYCRSILNNKGRLNIDGLGFFYSDLENNICFEPHQQLNFLTSSFGLSPVSVKELEPEVIKKEEVVFVDRVITHKEVEQKSEIKNKGRYKRIVTVSLSLALLFSTLLLVVSNNTISGKLKAAIAGKAQKTVYTPITYPVLELKDIAAQKQDYVADVNGISSLELENNKTIAVKAVEMEPVSTAVKTKHVHKTISTRKNFEVVLGCFSILNNANKLIKKLGSENVDAILSGKNEKGLYVVSGGGFDTKDEAIKELTQIKNTCPNAWIRKAD